MSYQKQKVRREFFNKLSAEREVQEKQYGQVPRDRTPSVYLIVLLRELGELAGAIANGDEDNYLEELTEVAAVATQAYEDYCLGRSKLGTEQVFPPIKYPHDFVKSNDHI